MKISNTKWILGVMSLASLMSVGFVVYTSIPRSSDQLAHALVSTYHNNYFYPNYPVGDSTKVVVVNTHDTFAFEDSTYHFFFNGANSRYHTYISINDIEDINHTVGVNAYFTFKKVPMEIFVSEAILSDTAGMISHSVSNNDGSTIMYYSQNLDHKCSLNVVYTLPKDKNNDAYYDFTLKVFDHLVRKNNSISVVLPNNVSVNLDYLTDYSSKVINLKKTIDDKKYEVFLTLETLNKSNEYETSYSNASKVGFKYHKTAVSNGKHSYLLINGSQVLRATTSDTKALDIIEKYSGD